MAENRYKFLSRMHLKWIALVTMVIDHIAVFNYTIIHYPTSEYCRNIGRIAFPLFCFLLTEGFVHTRSKKKYFLTVLIFAFITEIPFDWTFHHTLFIYSRGQNVFFTLAIGIMTLWLIEKYTGKKLLQTLCVAACMGLATLLNSEYTFFGIGLIVIMHIFKNRFFYMALLGSLWIYIGGGLEGWFYQRYNLPNSNPLSVMHAVGLSSLYGAFAFLFIFFYNGRKGHSLNKYFFYIFYSAHILILFYLRVPLMRFQ